MVHADPIFGVAGRPRMVFQTGLQCLAAYFAIVRLFSTCRGVGTVGGKKQHQHDPYGSHDCLLSRLRCCDYLIVPVASRVAMRSERSRIAMAAIHEPRTR